MAENATNNAGVAAVEGQAATEEKETKTYTFEEVQEMLQKEGDRRVSEAQKKFEKKSAEKLREAEKLAKMNADEKYAYELEQREAAIIAKEKALALAENKNEAAKVLADKGLSLDLLDFVVAEDAETMNMNIRLMEKAFKASVKAEVEKRMGSKTPQKNLADNEAMTKEKLFKMSAKDIQDFKNTNPTLFEKLMGE